MVCGLQSEQSGRYRPSLQQVLCVGLLSTSLTRSTFHGPLETLLHQGSRRTGGARPGHRDGVCEEKAGRGKMNNNRMPAVQLRLRPQFWRAILGEGESGAGGELKTSGDRKLNWRDWRAGSLSLSPSLSLSLALINYLGPSQLAARDCHI